MDAAGLNNCGLIRAVTVLCPDPDTAAIGSLTADHDPVNLAGRAGVENSREPDVGRSTSLVTTRAIHSDIGDVEGAGTLDEHLGGHWCCKILVTFAARPALGTVMSASFV